MTGSITNVVIFSFTEKGTKQSRCIYKKLKMQGYICEGYAPAKYVMEEDECGIKQLPKRKERLIEERWGKCAFLFIGAAGIAVRYIAPYVKDKFTDSAVVVADEAGQYVIPLLSGHVGGAAELADQVAELLGAVSVHTTATDVRKKFAVDVFAKKNALHITDRGTAKRISAAVLDEEPIGIYAEGEYAENAVKNSEEMFSDEVCICNTKEEVMKYRYRVILADSFPAADENTLLLKPKNVIVGLGCRKGISEELLEKGLLKILKESNLDMEQVEAIVSIDLKKEERAVVSLAEKYQVPFLTYPAETLKEIKEVSASSPFVEKITGVDNVCERAVLTYCEENCEYFELIRGKSIETAMTAAIARRNVKAIDLKEIEQKKKIMEER